jgi:hypothetical protein
MENSIETTTYSISGIFEVIKANFNFIILSFIIIAVSSVLYALTLPNIYTANAVLQPASIPSSSNKGGGSGGMGGSGIADFVGSIAGGASSDKNTVKALKIIESKNFFLSYYNNDEYLAAFEAEQSYDHATKKILFDGTKYNSLKKEWMPEQKPNFDQAHSNFLSVLAIDHDRLDGFITLSLDHISPQVATYWLESIITDSNTIIKNLETARASAQAAYFESKLNTTQIQALRQVISGLLLQTYETMAFASITDEFAFEYIDMPLVPERKSKPSRGFIVIFLCISIGILEFLILVFLSALGKKVCLSFRPMSLKLVSFDNPIT